MALSHMNAYSSAGTRIRHTHHLSLRADVAAPLPACLPALSQGMLRVYDLMVDGGNVLCEIQAHKGPLVGGAQRTRAAQHTAPGWCCHMLGETPV